jgi:hypothetical protein
VLVLGRAGSEKVIDIMKRRRGATVPLRASASGVVVQVALLLAAGCVIPGTGRGSGVRETFNRTVGAGGVEALDLESINEGAR